MSNPRRKHRGDSKLKTLAEDLQADIIARLKAGTAEQVIVWLKSEWDISTSQGALSDFFSWWHLQRRMENAEKVAVDHQEWLKVNTDLSPEQILKAGNLMFIAQASGSGDVKMFEAMSKLFLRARKDKANENFTERKLELEERRIQILEQKAEKADRIQEATKGKPSSEMTDTERSQLLKVIDESFGIKS